MHDSLDAAFDSNDSTVVTEAGSDHRHTSSVAVPDGRYCRLSPFRCLASQSDETRYRRTDSPSELAASALGVGFGRRLPHAAGPRRSVDVLQCETTRKRPVDRTAGTPLLGCCPVGGDDERTPTARTWTVQCRSCEYSPERLPTVALALAGAGCRSTALTSDCCLFLIVKRTYRAEITVGTDSPRRRRRLCGRLDRLPCCLGGLRRDGSAVREDSLRQSRDVSVSDDVRLILPAVRLYRISRPRGRGSLVTVTAGSIRRSWLRSLAPYSAPSPVRPLRVACSTAGSPCRRRRRHPGSPRTRWAPRRC